MLALRGQSSDKQDIASYTTYCKKGVLYDRILLELIKRGLVPSSTIRKDIKPIMFSVLFSSNRHHDKMKDYFKELFPSVYELFCTIKRTGKEKLPILLQHIESVLMLEMVSKRISKEKPSLPIFTIHDSIVTIKGYEDYVELVMQEEFFNLIGIIPSLEIEDLTPAKLSKRLEAIIIIKDAA